MVERRLRGRAPEDRPSQGLAGCGYRFRLQRVERNGARRRDAAGFARRTDAPKFFATQDSRHYPSGDGTGSDTRWQRFSYGNQPGCRPVRDVSPTYRSAAAAAAAGIQRRSGPDWSGWRVVRRSQLLWFGQVGFAAHAYLERIRGASRPEVIQISGGGGRSGAVAARDRKSV